MPNHCENRLIITGPSQDLLQLKVGARGKHPTFGDSTREDLIEELCCDKFIPIPKKVLKSYNDYGYDWCCKNWGSKWGAYDIYITPDGLHYPESLQLKELFYDFTTAWSPITPVVLAMSKQFPSLEFNYKYWECGMGFRGIFICKAGKIIKDNTYDYSGDRGG